MRRDPDTDRQLRDPNRLGEFERAPTVGPRLREGLTDHEWQRRKRERRQAKAPGVARMLTTATDAVKAAKRLAKTADKLADRVDTILGIRAGDLLSSRESQSGFERDQGIPGDGMAQRLMNLCLAVNIAEKALRRALEADERGWPDDEDEAPGVDKAG